MVPRMQLPFLSALLVVTGTRFTACFAFLLPPAARSLTTGVILDEHNAPPTEGSRRTVGSVEARWVVARRQSKDGESASGDHAAGTTVDIFEALMAGDVPGVKEYVEAGGDCSVRDSIGERDRNRERWAEGGREMGRGRGR